MRNYLQATACAMAAVVLTSGLVVFADPASANIPHDARAHAVVQTADLNLSVAAGRATAERRIERAAAQVCGTEGNAMSAGGRCRQQAIGNARAALQAKIAQR